METHRIREDNVFELQGNCGWVKMVYLGCAVKKEELTSVFRSFGKKSG
jgi:hypothetical protein